MPIVCFPTETWKRNKMGDLSTAGTTVSTVIFRQDNIFVANVGDSTAVLGELIHISSKGRNVGKSNPSLCLGFLIDTVFSF